MAPSQEQAVQVATQQEVNDPYLFAIQLATGSVLPMALQTAVNLGIFEIIAKSGPGAKLSAADIAAQMATKSQAAPIMVDRLARLLASHSILNCSLSAESERLYSLSPVSSTYFVPNQYGVCLGPILNLNHNKLFLESWAQLKEAVLEGQTAFDRAHGINAFEYAGKDNQFNQVFNLAMFNLNTIVMTKVVETYKGFEGIDQLVDVGGSQGLTLQIITSKYPNIKAINFDLPHVIQHAPSYPGVKHVAGDMFESVPEGDAIFMKLILHDWSDEQCLILLKNCYKAIPDNGKVIVVDSVVPVMAETTPSAKAAFLFDILMMSQHSGGKERTEQEIITLASKAGFKRVNFECVVCNYSVMEFYKN